MSPPGLPPGASAPTTALEPAALGRNAEGLPFSPRYGDIYHSRDGAFVQARQVFLAGNRLPTRWQGRGRFVVLETGFGLGNNFLATWQAWREDPQRCERLVFLSIEAHPLNRDELAQVHAASPLPDLAAALQSAWPPPTPDLHVLDFEGGRVRLMLAFGDVQAWLPQLGARVDAFFLDGFAPARNPRMWDERVCRALGRLAASGATLATWSAIGALRRHLRSAGFAVQRTRDAGVSKHEITLARFEPAFTPRRAPGRMASDADVDAVAAEAPNVDTAPDPAVSTIAAPAFIPAPARHALVVGAGLAGCAAAWALAEQGWRCTILERHPRIAAEASGNPAGLFHGIVNAQDGVHARFNRAAALMARESVRIAIAAHGVAGAADGLLRLERRASPDAMRRELAQLGLPPAYVQALDAAAASAHAGLALPHAAWLFPGGGWVDPAGLARSWLERAGPRVELRCGLDVQGLQPHEVDGNRRGWQLLDAAGRTIAEADTVVLANAGAALRLLGDPDWPMAPIRGQLSLLAGKPAGGGAAAPFPLPRLPVAGAGYLLPRLADGTAMFGATAQHHDPEPLPRAADHQRNLAQLATLLGSEIPLEPATLEGRVAWRWSAADRLPVIGAVPDETAAANRLDQPRFVPRRPGLFVFTALGSRGITWSALGARILAAGISGAPMPAEARLVDAVDPGRFVSRRARQAASAAKKASVGPIADRSSSAAGPPPGASV